MAAFVMVCLVTTVLWFAYRIIATYNYLSTGIRQTEEYYLHFVANRHGLDPWKLERWAKRHRVIVWKNAMYLLDYPDLKTVVEENRNVHKQPILLPFVGKWEAFTHR